MKIINKPYSDLDERKRNILYHCFTYEKGFMRETISNNFEGIDTFVVYEKGIIVGWAVITGWEEDCKLLMIYVHEDDRRKGIGTSLVRVAKQKYKNICIGRDDENKNFVDKMMFNEKIIVWSEK